MKVLINSFIKNNRLLFKVLEEITDSVVVVDASSSIVYVNTRLPNPNIIGKKINEVEPTSKFLRVLKTGDPVFNCRQLVETVGIELEVTFLPIIKKGTIIGAISIGRLISVNYIYDSILEQKNNIKEAKVKKKRPLPGPFQKLIGEDPAYIKVLEDAAAVAGTDANVLIYGESGVGKEVLSKAIHEASNRKDCNFEVVNCAAIPANLIESEFFGYERGAFTGASNQGKKGKFELAHKGTILLDEIGDISPLLQAKLLRAIQFKYFERVGGVKPISVDIRIIAATNKDLWEMVKAGTFRADMYHRLNVFPIYIPPLRKRKKDIIILANEILKKVSNSDNPIQLSDAVKKMFVGYPWPGNIRELKNTIERAYIYAASEGSSYILPKHVSLKLKKSDLHDPSNYLAAMEEGKTLPEIIETFEAQIIKDTLSECQYNKSRAIKKLAMSRTAFYNRIKKYGL